MTDEAKEPRTISPFKIMRRGEDTVDGDENLVFADFRPQVMDATIPEPAELLNPKDVSAPVPAPSLGSAESTVQTTSETIVEPSADEVPGVTSPGVDLKQASSLDPKSG